MDEEQNFPSPTGCFSFPDPQFSGGELQSISFCYSVLYTVLCTGEYTCTAWNLGGERSVRTLLYVQGSAADVCGPDLYCLNGAHCAVSIVSPGES